eukprot:scaffold973_cov399-Prasinococcus_capsulatus_cf.AAC.13
MAKDTVTVERAVPMRHCDDYYTVEEGKGIGGDGAVRCPSLRSSIPRGVAGVVWLRVAVC